jgi:hypothetical protein
MDYISTSPQSCCARTVARALLGNYQHLGLFDGSSLAILSPRKTCAAMMMRWAWSHGVTVDASDEAERRNIAITKAPAMPSKAPACLARLRYLTNN